MSEESKLCKNLDYTEDHEMRCRAHDERMPDSGCDKGDSCPDFEEEREENTSLVFLANADKALAQATDIWKLKEFRDKMLTVHDYTERHKLSVSVIDKARGYALEAERRLGEEIAKMPKNTGAAGVGSNQYEVRSPEGTAPPTLEELGISKKLSSQAQELAKLPDDKFDKLKAGKTTRKDVKAELKKAKVAAKVEEMAKAAEALPADARYKVYTGDMANVDFWFERCKYDAIITDPPYPKEFLPLYGTLAQMAEKFLKPGGIVCVMTGQTWLHEVLDLMCPHLQYLWTACFYMLPGPPTMIADRPVINHWKPLLMFIRKDDSTRTAPSFNDVFQGTRPEKDSHIWQQNEEGMFNIVSRLCKPGMSVMDPFSGSGTTGVAAIKYGCIYTGIEKEESTAKASITRLHEVKA